MRLRQALALAVGLLPLAAGLTEATAAQPPATSGIVAADESDADTDTDDVAADATETSPLKATKASGAPDYDTCRFAGYSIGSTCFKWVGDNQWVFDGLTNGWAAVTQVQTNYGKNRYCQALPSAEGWGYCNYDHVEGKCVRFRMYELKDGVTRSWGAWSKWYGTDYGWPCE
ncbi:hypothetical protein [Kribbella sp. NPDC004875]|uniref:hypothetical protein n=1 Tax=Kribbella sp. NPDC004875 TaxID=3364107 RepID=UPI003698B7A7